MISRRSGTHTVVEANQSWWQLAFIQLTGMMSIPVLASSVIILQRQNFTSAVLTVTLGNILLWAIRYGILRLSHSDRKSALDVTFEYMGVAGGYIVAAALLADTLAWFVVQTSVASNALDSLIDLRAVGGFDRFLQISVLIGVVSTLFCVEGIRSLKLLAIIAFPILALAFLSAVVSSPTFDIDLELGGPSLTGLGLILGSNLGVSVDLPTFFRHSRSWKDSYRALTAIQIGSLLIGIGGVFLSAVIKPQLGTGIEELQVEGLALRIVLIIFVLFSVISSNVSNVYSASVGWELIAPAALVGKKEYLILGLGLTTTFILIANFIPLETLLLITDSAMVNLCLVFFSAYLITNFAPITVGSSLRIFFLLGWLGATVYNAVQVIRGGLLFRSTILVSLILIGLFAILGFMAQRLGNRPSNPQ